VNILDALEKKQLLLYYQPIVDLQQHSAPVVGYEALLRCKCPDRGFLLPKDFLPSITQAKITDFKWQTPLFNWVFTEACRTAATLEDGLYLSVNVEPMQFLEAGFVARVKQTIEQLNLKGRICFEITEHSIASRDLLVLQQELTLLTESAKVALDDVWTGNASLWRISELYGLIDLLKIDRVFMPKDSFDRKSIAIFRCFVTLADALDLQTVAEGIETQQQVDFCRSLGVRFAQGFFFGKAQAELAQ
jgi:EAL domain-containing protein (putative c-di-GMP-specific phosphodiesterase class I)